MKIDMLIAMFNKDTVVFQDLNTFRQELNKIFDAFTGLQQEFLNF